MPADLECPATPPELPREPTPERVKLSPGRQSSDSPGRASPDSACPICLGKLDNKAFSDGCMHQFCFTCILEWSKVRAVCPLCKQGFTSIIHNVRSELDYDRYRLPPPPPVAPDPQNPYIYRPGHGVESRSRWLQMRRHQYHYRSLVLPMLWPAPEALDYRLPTAPARPRPSPRSRVTSESRRHLYESDMWARPTADELTGRYRETGPDFYRNNPACTHRLVPWLNRELNAVLDSPAHLAHVMEHIMELITGLHILSPEFRAHLQPYMGHWTEHFVHELYCYARSPYDMVGYDLHVQYQAGRPASPPAQVMASSTESDGSGSDSDIQVLTPPPRPSTPLLVEPPSPEPGPSGVSAALGRVRAFLAEARAAEASSDSDSDSPLEVVEVLPPRHERPPVIVTLSSDDEPPPPPPPPPPPSDADLRRAARLERRAAAGAKRAQRRDGAQAREGRRHSGEGPSSGRRRHAPDGAAEDAAATDRRHKHRASRASNSRDREADREDRRRRRADERASKSSERSSKSKSSEASSKSKSSEASSKFKCSEMRSKSKSSMASSKSNDKTSERSSKYVTSGKTDEAGSKSHSSGRSAKSKSVETIDSRSPKHSDRSHRSKSSDKSHKSKHRDRSRKPKSSDRSQKSSTRSSTGRHVSSGKRHGKRTKDDSRSRHRKRSRLDSDSSAGPCDFPASPDSPQPSTSAGVAAAAAARPRLFQRIVLPSSSPSEAVSSSSSSVTGARARGARCRRLSDTSSDAGTEAGHGLTTVLSDTDSEGDSESVGLRRSVVRSAVVKARRAASSDDSDCAEW